MKITINPVLDMETLQWVSNDGTYEHDGPVADFKGSKVSAQDQANQAQAASWASPLMAMGQSQLGPLSTEFRNETYNPQGLGQQAINQMITQSGQNTAGALGSAEERNRLAGARSGNSAFSGAANNDFIRQALGANANTGLDVNLANDQLKQQQQQAGIAGMEGLSQQEIESAMNALNTSSGASNAWSQAYTAYQPFEQVMSGIGSLGAGVGAAAKGILSCWVAAATFGGWDDPRTQLVRQYLFGPVRETRIGRFFTDLYVKYGERISQSKAAMVLMRPLFRLILKFAERA